MTTHKKIKTLAFGVARSTTTAEPPSSWVSDIKFSTESVQQNMFLTVIGTSIPQYFRSPKTKIVNKNTARM